MFQSSLTLSLLGTFFFTCLGLHLLIQLQHQQKIFQFIRPDGPQSHLVKKRTPTAGGFCIVLGQIIFLLLTSQEPVLIIYCLSLGLFSLLGLLDDTLKISSKGMSSRVKFLSQCLITIFLLSLFSMDFFKDINIFTQTFIPFLGLCSVPAFLLVFLNFFTHISTSNATNLTDGQDGLLTQIFLCLWIAFLLCFFLATQDQNHFILPNYESFIFIALANIVTLSAFLLFNHYPAQIFMGDCGSLALGGALATTMMMILYPFGLLIVASIPLVETLSVILQVFSFKTYGTRIFKMAPLHHHFELSGYHETTVTTRFVFVNTLLAFCAWSSYFHFSG